MISPDATPHLVITTVAVPEIDSLIRRADPRNPLVWLRRGEGMVGLGETFRITTTGTNRFRKAKDHWQRISRVATVDDQVGLSGTGLVAFGAFAFASGSAADSVLIIPQLVLGNRDGRSWITHIRIKENEGEPLASPKIPQPAPRRQVPQVSFSAGNMSPEAYIAAVGELISRIREGQLRKAVLARQLVGQLSDDAGLRATIDKLANDYNDTWVFAVDGLIGASPETLVRVDHGTVTARVLAGTAPRGRNPKIDRDFAEKLINSAKNRSEHAIAVASTVKRLAQHTSRFTSNPAPFLLKLPNLWHLATDLKGTLGDGSTALDLVQAVHPTAAVAGTPRRLALRTITELEGFDRGRYAGPVGWIDGNGDGEWAIALRCAQVDPNGTVTAYAGCGIVHDSSPEDELAETMIKFQPIVSAFGG